jgi:GNAT superfamily N-acetyltransferase
MDERAEDGINVRVATVNDTEALFEVRTSVTENFQSLEDLETLGVTPASVRGMLGTSSRGWVVEDCGQVVGFSMADASVGTVFGLFVRPTHQGRGIGARLLGEAERWLYSRGWEEIWLTTGSDPALRANGFYRRVGWRAVGVEANGEIKYVKVREA